MFEFYDVYSLVAQASNVVDGDNPTYTSADFLAFYPQFSTINVSIINAFVKLAHANIKEARYHDSWPILMANYIAHFLELYNKAAASGAVEPIITSESAGDVSWSGEISSITNDLNGWGAFKQTQYGVNFASMARLFNLGGMYVQ